MSLVIYGDEDTTDLSLSWQDFGQPTQYSDTRCEIPSNSTLWVVCRDSSLMGCAIRNPVRASQCLSRTDSPLGAFCKNSSLYNVSLICEFRACISGIKQSLLWNYFQCCFSRKLRWTSFNEHREQFDQVWCVLCWLHSLSHIGILFCRGQHPIKSVVVSSLAWAFRIQPSVFLPTSV